MDIVERNKKVEENLPLVTYCLQLLEVPYNEDYFQQGVLELIRCVENFDESKGLKFSTYATKNIRWYLSEYIKRDYIIKPKHVGNRGSKVEGAFCDSLDRTINSEGKEISLGDTIESFSTEGDIETMLFELDQEEFFKWAVKEYNIEKEDLNLFLDYSFNGWEKKKNLGSKYGITIKEVNKRLNEIKKVLQQAYKAYNKN